MPFEPILTRLADRLHPISLIAGGLLMAMGLVVIGGWLVESEAVVRIRPGLAVMQFNTALSFVLAGAGLLALWRQNARLCALFGALTTLLAALVLAEHVTGIGLGVDALFVDPFTSDRFSQAGRMSAPTALVFLAAGCGEFIGGLYSQRTSAATLVGTCAAAAATLGGLALIGYGLDLVSSDSFKHLHGMALHTAVGSVVLGIGLLSQMPAIARQRLNGVVFWVAGPIGMVGLTLAVSLWLAVTAQYHDRVRDLLTTRGEAFATILTDKVARRTQSLMRIAQTQGGAPGDATPDARPRQSLYQAVIPELQALLVMTPTQTRWLTPAPKPDRDPRLSYEQVAAQWQRARTLQTGTDVLVTRSTRAAWSDHTLQVLVDLRPQIGTPAFLLAVLDIDDLIGPIADSYLAQGYGSGIMADDEEIFARRPMDWPPDRTPHFVTTLDLAGGQMWLLDLAITPELRKEVGAWLPLSTLLVGLSFALLLTTAAHLWQRALKSKRDTELANLQLARENEVRTWAESHFRSLVDAAPNALLIVDGAGHITLVNAHTLQLFGYRQDELLGRPIEVLIPERLRGPHPGWRENYTRAPTKRPMGTGRELFGLRKDGSEFPADISLSPLGAQENLEIICAVVDLTEHKRTEMNLRRSNATLESVNQELEAFSYSVSHDLRQPLRAMIGFGEILEEDYADKLDAQGRDSINRIRSAAERMGRLIDDLLALSRITRTKLLHENLDLSALADEVIERLRRENPDREVAVSVSPGLRVEGDPRMVRIMMDNLLSNAWKFTSKTPDARIEVGTTGENGRSVYFVRDNGAGFDMAYQEQLFGAFQRLHAVDEFPGTGVGLATVKRIITRHHGRIWAESAVGQGATFYFELG